MKIENKHWIIIAIVVILIALWYFFMKKKPTTSNYAGMYGSFGNESNYVNCSTHKCAEGCDAIGISNGKCGCKCYRQGSPSGVVWTK